MTNDDISKERTRRLRQAGRLVKQIRLAYYQINQIFLSSGLDVNGNSGAFSILTDIYFRGPKTIPELLEERAITRQNIHRMIKVLKADGIVEYIDNPDHKRSKKIALTKYGKRHFLQQLKILDNAMEPIANSLTDQEISSAHDTLLVVRDGLDNFLKALGKSDNS